MNERLSPVLKSINDRHAWLFMAGIVLLFNTALFVAFKNSGKSYNANVSILIYCIELFLFMVFSLSVFLKSKRIDGFTIRNSRYYLAVALAWLARIALSRTGHNYDLESFELVADHVLNGDNLYASTNRYNYGPIWAYLCAGMKYLSSIGGGYNQLVFHSYMSSVLFVFELILLKQLSKIGFTRLDNLIWLFNPISIILIGHHSQFDIMALALGFLSVNKLQENKTLQAALIMGLSLSLKHILAFFPLLLLFNKELKTKDKLIFLFVPFILFAMSFTPFLDAWNAIKQNVIGYQLNHGKTLIYKAGESVFPDFITNLNQSNPLPFSNAYKPLWLGIILSIGYILKDEKSDKNLMAYTCVLVAFSPAISEQYFLIPMVAIIYLRKYAISWLYILTASFYLLFVSVHNTAQYLNFESLGLALDGYWIKVEFYLIQLLLALISIQLVKVIRARRLTHP